MELDNIWDWNKDIISSGDLGFKLNLLEKDLIGAEIGVFQGWNLYSLLKNAPNIKKIFAIDPYIAYDASNIGDANYNQNVLNYSKEKAYNLIKENSLLDKVNFIYLTSNEALEQIKNESLDFIFIDANHSYESAYEDFCNYFAKVKPGGIFSGHDKHLPTVFTALKDFSEKNNINFPDEYLDLGNGSAWAYIKPLK